MAIKIHYQTLGSGKPVIILHGLFGSSRNWSSIAKRLSEQYQVINVDLRNHGESDHVESMTYPEMAGDIALIIEENNLDKAHIIGHSLGGKVAMTFALQFRSMLDRLVVLDIAPVFYQNDFNFLIDSMQRLVLEEISSRKHAGTLLSTDIPDDPMRLFLIQNLVQRDDGYHWRINLQTIKESLFEISNFPAPPSVNSHSGKTLFLSGENSEYIQPDHHPIIKQYFSNTLIHSVKDAGHWLHADQPDKVLEMIISFLDESETDEPASLLYRT